MTTRDVSVQSDIAKSFASQPKDSDGSFNRHPSTFRETITKGSKYEPEKGRYHLYVSYACPWAHRTLITRILKGLEDFIDVTIVSPHMGEHGWPFAVADVFPGAGEDPVLGAKHLKDIYLKVSPDYEGRFTVPVLFDKKTQSIVNNESSEIIRIFNTAFNDLLPGDKAGVDIYPEALRKQIDESNEWVYHTINNGVYRTGFSLKQGAYETAFNELFSSLDRIEAMLTAQHAAQSAFFIGNRLTEADIRLYTTIVRFDPVYHGHFKCNARTIRDGYSHIHQWLRNLYWNYPAFKDTTNFQHIKEHYYWSHSHVNPSRIVPLGPVPSIRPLDEQ